MKIRCGLIAVACLASALKAQFSGLASNADGSALGFSLAGNLKFKDRTSWRAPSGTRLEWTSAPKYFRQWSNDGTRALTQQSTGVLGNRPGCNGGGSSCLTRINTTILTIEEFGAGSPRTIWAPGANVATQAWMNSNGQDVVWQGGSRTMLTDLIPAPPKDRQLAEPSWNIIDRIADGRLLVSDLSGLSLRGVDGDIEPLRFRPAAGYVFIRKISGDGRRMIYQTGIPGTPGYSLRAQDLKTGEDVELHAGLYGQDFVINRDGTVVLFSEGQESLRGGPLFLAQHGGVRRVLESEEVPAASYTLSGDGRQVFCATVSGKILRLNLDALAIESAFFRAVTELVPRTPYIRSFYDWATPGSQVLVYGTGLADRQAGVKPGEAWPEELDGISLGTDKLALPLGMVSPALIRTQIPFDAPSPLENLAVSSESPFQQMVNLNLSGSGFPNLVDIDFLAQNPDYLPFKGAAVYRDTNPREPIGVGPHRIGPVHPNERIHILVTGLGPVSPAVANGAPAPADPPALIQDPVACWMDDTKQEIPVEFAGLEAGLTGIYRITLRLPERLGPELRCGRDPSRTSGMFLILDRNQ